MPRVIYISSTGVYGQVEGEWVDESTPCRPTREGGRAALAAEEVLRGHPLGQCSVVLRLAGIYGPDRIPRAGDIVAGRPIDAPAEGFLNLIHVEDAARIVVAAAERDLSLPALYCVTDGHPTFRRDYYTELARLLSAPPPMFSPPDEKSHARQRAGSDKRVSNRRMMSELAVELAYPSFREGLAAIVRGKEAA
jgi:nucleoside-diphosphate-sugar epimerase